LYARELEELAVLADLFLQIGDLLLDPIASVPAMKRRGGGTFPATVRNACASFAGRPECFPFCSFQNANCAVRRSS
jgi:hypothetical protein